jgi:hypothetical protein
VLAGLRVRDAESPFLVRVAGIVQVAKSSETSVHVIPASSLAPLPGQHETDESAESAPDTKSRTCLHIDLWTRSAVYFQVVGKQ